MNLWSGRSLLWGIVTVVFFALIIKVSWGLLLLSTEHHPLSAADLNVEYRDGRVLLTLSPDNYFREGVTGVVLPVGPDEISLPGLPVIWQEMAEALPREKILRDEKQGFDGLQLVDLPSQFERRAHTHIELAHEIVSFARVGEQAYLLNSEGQVLIMDLRHPARPSVAGGIPLEMRVRSMSVFKGALYLLTQLAPEYEPQLVVMDISTPMQPQELFRQKLPAGAEFIAPCKDYLGIQGGKLDGYAKFLNLYRVSEDHKLVLDTSVDGIWSGNVKLAVGDFWYVARLRGGLIVYSMADPMSPFEVARIELPERFISMARVADRLFIWGTLGNLYIIDISNPTKPLVLTTEQGGTYLFRIAIIDEYTYVFGRNGSLHVFNGLPQVEPVPPTPVIEAELLLPHSDRSGFLPILTKNASVAKAPEVYAFQQGVNLPGDLHVIAGAWWHERLLLLSEGRLQWFAIDDHRSVSSAAQIPLPETIRWLTTTDERIYLGGDDRLLVVGATADGELQLQKTVLLPQTRTWSAVAHGSNLLVAAGEQGLLRFSLKVPDRPESLPVWSLPRQLAEVADLRHLAIFGDRVYASAGPAGLLVGQLTENGTLELTGRIALGDTVEGLIVSDGICLAATPETIHVVDVRAPAALQRLGEVLFVDVDRMVLASPKLWAGHVPGKGWTILPMPRLLLEEDGPGEEVSFSIPKLPGPPIYHINLFDRRGVTELPGIFILTGVEEIPNGG